MRREFYKYAALLAAALVFCLSGCSQQLPFEPQAVSQTDSSGGNGFVPEVNEDGLIVIQIPKILLAGYSAEDLEEEDRVGRQKKTQAELDEALWSALLANEDGTFSYYFTPEQYQRTKDYYYQAALLKDPVNGGFQVDFAVETAYTEWDEYGIPRRILVKVDREKYNSFPMMNVGLATVMPSVCLGRYQILCGVSSEECHVQVQVEDYETGKLVLETDFPEISDEEE